VTPRPKSIYDSVLSAKSPIADPEPVDLGHRARLDPRVRPPARQRQLEQDRERQRTINADRAALGNDTEGTR